MKEKIENQKLLHPFPKETTKISLKSLLIIFLLTIFFGVFSGWVTFQARRLFFNKKQIISQSGEETPKKIVGVQDKKTFKDHAEGILREGGIDGEGQFHLERPGGESQNVYLTSSIVDLSQFVGKKVRVWGETFAGQKAGWLMNVGLVEVL